MIYFFLSLTRQPGKKKWANLLNKVSLWDCLFNKLDRFIIAIFFLSLTRSSLGKRSEQIFSKVSFWDRLFEKLDDFTIEFFSWPDKIQPGKESE